LRVLFGVAWYSAGFAVESTGVETAISDGWLTYFEEEGKVYSFMYVKVRQRPDETRPEWWITVVG
jgi:hypothetical protein